MVLTGAIARNARARLRRDGAVAYDGKIGSLKRFKDDVKEVAAGFECGIGLDGWNDVKAKDVIETYTIEEIARRIQ
jgi:translation initiation factor IF-2